MRVLIFIETGGPGGAERVVLELARGLSEAGVSVIVVTLRTGWLTEMLVSSGIRHIHLKSECAYDVSLPFKLARIAKEENVDVIHSHLLDSNFYGSIAARLAKRPHVGTEHGDVHHTDGKRFVPFKLKTMWFFGSHLTSVSRYSADKLQALGFPASRITVVPNPVTKIIRSGDTRSEVRKAFGIESDSVWIWVHVANLRPVKDQETLIRGFAHSVSRTKESQRLLLVGDGPQRDRLESLAKELGAPVVFAGHRDDVGRILQAADGFILSSLSESMPMALLEAASAGLYLISSAVGGVPELIDETSGRLFPAGDPEALSRTICSVLAVPDAARAAALTTQDRICRERSLPKVCDIYKALYAKL